MSQATMKVQPKTKDQQTGAHAVLTARRIVAYAVLILLCALCLFFFYVLIINATRPHADIQKGFSFLPGSWTSLCNNFTQVINNANIPIISGMRNSLIVSAMTAIFACYFSALTAFGIHAYRFKGRALALTFILLIMTMPTQVSALGFLRLMTNMKLTDTLIPLFRDGKGGVGKNRILAGMYSDLRQKITGEPYRDKNESKKTFPNGYNVITFDNGDVYEGNISEGMFHGQGKYTSHNGLIYEGHFAFNKPKGKGKLYCPNLYTYVGGVNDYNPDGYGRREDVDGTTVCGMWKNGLPNGLVSHYFPNKDIYIGEVSNGDFVGIGVYLSPNGDISAGKFNNECLTYGEVMQYKSSFKRITSGILRTDRTGIHKRGVSRLPEWARREIHQRRI